VNANFDNLRSTELPGGKASSPSSLGLTQSCMCACQDPVDYAGQDLTCAMVMCSCGFPLYAIMGSCI
jgi:hypothetical protein